MIGVEEHAAGQLLALRGLAETLKLRPGRMLGAASTPEYAIRRWALGAVALWRSEELEVQCEEGDLNPHGCYPTRPST